LSISSIVISDMASVFEHVSSSHPGPPLAASEAKRLLIEKYLRGDLATAEESFSVIPRHSQTKRQLSFAQERLWFIDQLMPGSAAFNVPMAVKLSGPIRVGALQRAIDEIVRRHESLRTTFVTADGGATAVIAPRCDTPIEVIDLTSLEVTTREAETHRLVEQETLRPFDLSRGPLIRAQLIKSGGDDSVLVVTMHHIVSDGWSLLLFFKELSTLYDAFSQNLGSPLQPLPIQYSDYACWQRDWLADEMVERQLSYWKGQLSGELPILDLPADQPRPAMQTFAGAREVAALPADLTRSLMTSVSGRHNTLHTLLAPSKCCCIGSAARKTSSSARQSRTGRARRQKPLSGCFSTISLCAAICRAIPVFWSSCRRCGGLRWMLIRTRMCRSKS
jgi:hypothetical protein